MKKFVFVKDVAQLSNKKGGKFKHLLSKVFLSYKDMSIYYPSLKKCPILFPFYQVRRWCRILFCGGRKAAMNEIKVNKNITKEEQESQIKKRISGSEDTIGEKQAQALSMIAQFHLPDGTSPEQYLHNMILKYEQKTSEFYKAADEIKAVIDSHQWLYKISEQTGFSTSEIVHEIYRVAASSDDMINYTEEITKWLLSVKESIMS